MGQQEDKEELEILNWQVCEVNVQSRQIISSRSFVVVLINVTVNKWRIFGEQEDRTERESRT